MCSFVYTGMVAFNPKYNLASLIDSISKYLWQSSRFFFQLGALPGYFLHTLPCGVTLKPCDNLSDYFYSMLWLLLQAFALHIQQYFLFVEGLREELYFVQITIYYVFFLYIIMCMYYSL